MNVLQQQRCLKRCSDWVAECFEITDPVIARSAATKQSILPLLGEIDCFAALQ
jgi:hypothetical protein